MGKIIVQPETTKEVFELMGREAGICYGKDTSDVEKNKKRGAKCIKSGHGRVLEFPQVYLILDGYSARAIRELYTHIAGDPSRLQASTRYIGYDGFDYFIPEAIEKNKSAKIKYDYIMNCIAMYYSDLLALGIKKEDAANILPLGMFSKMVLRTNLRHMIEIFHQRLCTRAYKEVRKMMNDIIEALSSYSQDWKRMAEMGLFVPKCEAIGYCTEENSCGRLLTKEQFDNMIKKCYNDNITNEKMKNILMFD